MWSRRPVSRGTCGDGLKALNIGTSPDPGCIKRGKSAAVNDVAETIDDDRRRFLARAAMTIAALATPAETKAAPRELAALASAKDWLDSPRLTPETLTGKVVLVDFWTYTCINWLRTLPYVHAWAQNTAGPCRGRVHTPEFAFEHDINNVRRAARQMAIDYPIAIDNDTRYGVPSTTTTGRRCTWSMRRTSSPPSFRGGESDRSEIAIQRLLAEAGVAGKRSKHRVGRCQWLGSARGLEQPQVWRKLSRVRADGEFRVASRRHLIDVAFMRCRHDWHSISGRSRATGQLAGRRPS